MFMPCNMNHIRESCRTLRQYALIMSLYKGWWRSSGFVSVERNSGYNEPMMGRGRYKFLLSAVKGKYDPSSYTYHHARHSFETDGAMRG